MDLIVSDDGYGANAYIETQRPLVVVTAPGPGSGKLATCLSQLYHEHKRGVEAGYAKFETFPIWNLDLKHQVNVAYEAAAALILNAAKHLANIPDEIHLLAPGVIDGIKKLKENILSMRTISLDLEETLIALAVSSTNNPSAQMAMEKLTELAGCHVHSTHIPTPGDEAGMRRLDLNVTSDPDFATKYLFVR